MKKTKTIMTVLCFILLLTGMFFFWVGFHNVDTCTNRRMMEKQFNLTLSEIQLGGKVWSLVECYLNGLKQIIIGFHVGVMGAFLLGLNWGKNDRQR